MANVCQELLSLGVRVDNAATELYRKSLYWQYIKKLLIFCRCEGHLNHASLDWSE